MPYGFFTVDTPLNEITHEYRPGSPERTAVHDAYKKMFNTQMRVPLYLGDEEVYTNETRPIRPPHDHQHIVGSYSVAKPEHVKRAIDNALTAKKEWAAMSWEHRISIFIKAADLIAGPYRAMINAGTMINQSKNIFQAEIDATCESVDFLKFNAAFASDIYQQQPAPGNGVFNRIEHRPLEGFTYAVTPFNFTAIAINLTSCMAMMGNVVVWKPSDHQMYTAKIIMDIFKEAGLPDGVITLVSGDPEMITDIVLKHPAFAGLHFTGSTFVFQELWQKIGQNIKNYKTYPRIVGETGGKDFILAHPTADIDVVATAITRGAFEYQGQKCSAASRIYLPKSTAQDIIDKVVANVKSFTMGSPEDMSHFITAVIHEGSFDKLVSYIDQAKKDNDVEVLVGGTYDKSKGYFVSPTVLRTTNPKYTTMETELFGPVVTIHVYDDEKWDETIDLVDSTSIYGLTGAVIAQDRYVIEEASKRLVNAAGNFYINDKPSGAVVGQQPFGGARASGTNDKAGSMQNLLRWVSPRLIKETMVPAKDYRYPHMG
ncbi:MAG: L-glutamate gamma-semialdehyde dehydrogenase [Flavobacteriaceae bacterium]|jgi:1-pyrroline-5-carboxylate dehydrogenase|nr:L-glutamate gamma-semialdehyde dehydrogenase [Flavobacteriaceae bacterium]MDG0967647.1 L-glutamate gamma-semialdehyde dehydrogenase [Flavobacteriaceae bacterium]